MRREDTAGRNPNAGKAQAHPQPIISRGGMSSKGWNPRLIARAVLWSIGDLMIASGLAGPKRIARVLSRAGPL